MTKILAFAGSNRKGSYNKRLVEIAAQGALTAGADVTVIDLRDFSVPIFNQDDEQEQGMPEKAREFKRLLIHHDGFLIASPEYNGAFSPFLKNMIDWASRKENNEEPPLLAFRGKLAAIMASSPGSLGGLRGLMMLRMLLGHVGVTVLADQQTVPNAHKAFAGDGTLIDQQQQQAILSLGTKLTKILTSATPDSVA